MSIHILSGPKRPSWGDYSDILLGGIAVRQAGLLILERTGPFIPPISFPEIDTALITDNLKLSLELSDLTGLSFRPVVKKRIVDLEWETWDFAANEPQYYPTTGEPEDYILQLPHSARIADQIGDIWEIGLEEHAIFVPYQGLSNLDGTDWFRVAGQAAIYISDKAKLFLERVAPEWVSLTQAITT